METTPRRVPNAQRFGYERDAAEAGRRGGQASGLARRLRQQRQLEEMILASNNGAAKAKVLEIRMRRESELDAARIEADNFVHQLTTEADGLEQTIADLHAEVDELRDEFGRLINARHALFVRVTALDQRETELRARLDSDAGLDEWLRTIGEERATASAYRLGWAVDEDESDVEA